MKNLFSTRAFALLAIGAIACAAVVAQATGVPLQQFISPDVAIGVAGLGMAGITNFVQEGHCLDLDPGAAVPAGTGRLFGAALFGVAAVDGANGVASSFITSGVVTIAKTSALAIAVGDRLFWDAANSVVNKTAVAQQQVGVAVEAAANPSPTVKMKIMQALPVAT